jgi:hypothetical protein
MIALITPTGGRPKQIELCTKFMKHQDYEGKVLWVIVDDVDPTTISGIPSSFRDNWEIQRVYPEPKWKEGIKNTQSRNLIVGLNIVSKYEVEAIFIIEDDDYYSPQYLSTMMEKIKDNDVAGQRCTVYYNPIYRGWMRNANWKHSSLFQVAFTPKMIPLFETCCLMKRSFIDMAFFKLLGKDTKVNLFDGKDLAIGIKGLPGRAGIGMGHHAEIRMTPDPEFVKLKELIGDDYMYYL